MQERCRKEEEKQIQAQIGGQVLSREIVLLIFEQLQRLEKQITNQFIKELPIEQEEGKEVSTDQLDSEQMFELQYKHDVAEAQYFDKLYIEKQIDEQVYLFSLKKMDV